jgi:FkbM family methyltransferase
MLTSLGNAYALALGWPALRRLNRALYYLAGRALGLDNYSSMALSGELKVIGRLLEQVAYPVIFDVGANEGRWLAQVLAQSPEATIHAFEPQADLASKISALGHKAITINVVAVGDAPGQLVLHDYADQPGSSHASLVKDAIEGVHRARSRAQTVDVTTIDHYCSEHGVGHIDLLKVDVEGFEMQVLAGARQMIAQGQVSAIQFEFTSINVLARNYIADFMALLDRDFDVYRLLPHGLMPLDAGDHWFNEQFGYQNLLALRQKRSQASPS